MFQPETVSRSEAECAFAKTSKQLKIRGLLRPFFGTLPASIKSSSRKKIEWLVRPIHELPDELMEAAKFWRWIMEGSLEFEKILADDEQNI